jgi:hypothetical protein
MTRDVVLNAFIGDPAPLVTRWRNRTVAKDSMMFVVRKMPAGAQPGIVEGRQRRLIPSQRATAFGYFA